MLVDVKAKIADEEIQELLNYALWDGEDNDSVIDLYIADETYKLYAFQEEEQFVGLIGYRSVDRQVIELLHLVVHPEARGMGYGRGMILDALVLEQPSAIVAETDEDGADFFRSIGFQVTGFIKFEGGPEYFRCIYESEEHGEG
ncbi:GNAT family N-acetyltransferase [Paenibacillus fonticola]|uniref:GNAT family N-acetyltransferase n=1 Tax=Paenibacillus fonticola TaxID=379896 RepID=UPI00037A71BD|nr:GNAT family N-acetyltransferase [Paenibacillus fonticola]